MIKKIIFDLDDTLIKWKDEYNNSILYALDDLNIKYDNMIVDNINKAIADYEKYNDTYDINKMHKMFEEYSKLKIPYEFMDKWLYHIEKCHPNKNLELEKTLEYLSSKYELVVLTNWFTKTQENRLRNYGIIKYFKEVIGTDNIKNKPNKEAFLYACKPYKENECLMVGDNYEIDIKKAKELGLKTIQMGVDIKNIDELRREPWN